MIRDWINEQLYTLMPLRGMPEDLTVYFDALKDIPEPVFTRAMGHALKTRVWFPTPAEIRMDCDQVAARQRSAVDTVYVPREPAPDDRSVTIANPFGGKDLTFTVGRDWTDDCDLCHDSGWHEMNCLGPDHERRACLRGGKSPCCYSHPFMIPCECIPTNPTIQRRRAASAKYAQDSKK